MRTTKVLTPKTPSSKSKSQIRTRCTGLMGAIVVGSLLSGVAITAPSPAGATTTATYTPGSPLTPPSPLPSGPPGTVIGSWSYALPADSCVFSGSASGVPSSLTGVGDTCGPAAAGDAAPPVVTGVSATLVEYISTDQSGQIGPNDPPTVVSALVMEPTGTPPAGGWPVLTWAHGSTGLGATCAPSLDFGTTSTIGSTAYVAQAVDYGYAVVASDYEGLGVNGYPPSASEIALGHNVLDAVRAARNLTSAGVITGITSSSKVVVWGHSEGGGVSLFTAEDQPTYAPDVDLVGAIAGDPAAEFEVWADEYLSTPTVARNNNADNDSYALSYIAGLEATYPNAPYSSVLNSFGQSVVSSITGQCGQTISNWVTLWGTVNPAPDTYFSATASQINQYLGSIFQENTPGNITIPQSIPVFLYTESADDLIPTTQVSDLATSLCQDNEIVTGEVYNPPAGQTWSSGEAHINSLAQAATGAFGGDGAAAAFLANRVAGVAPTNSCPAA